ncbi:uracil-DNA glycosylase family protein [Pontibacter sp. G13]|uniref:uracil-DNA glycosylase family protein n=1 Tax=Pontibacter sp. G13 TaxID=3074898 RepID=UPI00288A7592|nr:uracil-DNA glycosylase family protein [Pontibacter sp. G13]WNJ16931.1 uracil-DNA glycosylase family protein [Pontibacter sp. G13]
MQALEHLLNEIRGCRHCEAHLPLGPRPVLAASHLSKILIVGQAPGTKVHASGVPWNDPSGVRLRNWLDVSDEQFYDHDLFAIVPMGFCYPGKGTRGDLPPRPECAELWQDKLMGHLGDVKLTLAIGQYAIKWHLGKRRKKTLAETVKHWEEYMDLNIFPLPHPSPRNIMWRRKNPWFEEEVVPALSRKVWEVIGQSDL